MDNTRLAQYGTYFAEVLGKPRVKGFYLTDWGKKTPEGFARTILELAQTCLDEQVDGLERKLG